MPVTPDKPAPYASLGPSLNLSSAIALAGYRRQSRQKYWAGRVSPKL